MVVGRNPVNGAMFMILSLVGVAGLFVLLNAFFLAVLQILVYAGAVMVLFLFIVMLLDVDVVSKRSPGNLTIAAGTVSVFLLGLGFVALLDRPQMLPEPTLLAPERLPSLETPMAFVTGIQAYGYSLFTKYMLPFQMTGLLLLVAMIGIIVLSKRFENKSV